MILNDFAGTVFLVGENLIFKNGNGNIQICYYNI